MSKGNSLAYGLKEVLVLKGGSIASHITTATNLSLETGQELKTVKNSIGQTFGVGNMGGEATGTLEIVEFNDDTLKTFHNGNDIKSDTILSEGVSRNIDATLVIGTGENRPENYIAHCILLEGSSDTTLSLKVTNLYNNTDPVIDVPSILKIQTGSINTNILGKTGINMALKFGKQTLTAGTEFFIYFSKQSGSGNVIRSYSGSDQVEEYSIYGISRDDDKYGQTAIIIPRVVFVTPNLKFGAEEFIASSINFKVLATGDCGNTYYWDIQRLGVAD